MTSFRMYQICRSSEGWQPVEVPSSRGDMTYVVLVNPWGNPKENICHCEGYVYRGQCRHQDEAAHKICGWTDLVGPEAQRDPKERICPRCGGPTKFEIEVA